MKPSVQFFSLCGVFLLAWFSQFPLALAEDGGAKDKPAPPPKPIQDVAKEVPIVKVAPPPPVELDHNHFYSSDYFPCKPDIQCDCYEYGFPYPFYQNHHHGYIHPPKPYHPIPHHPKPYLPKPHHPHTFHYPHYPSYPSYPHKPIHPYPYYPITPNCLCSYFSPYEYDTYKKPYYLN